MTKFEIITEIKKMSNLMDNDFFITELSDTSLIIENELPNDETTNYTYSRINIGTYLQDLYIGDTKANYMVKNDLLRYMVALSKLKDKLETKN